MLVLLMTLGVLWPTRLPKPVKSGDVLIANVNVVDVERGEVIKDQNVLLKDGMIAALDSAVKFEIPEDVMVIEGLGKYLIPGLWDMHAHLGFKPVSLSTIYPLHLAHGATSIRDPYGSMEEDDPFIVTTSDKRYWNEQVDNATLVGPKVRGMGTFPIGSPTNLLTGFPEMFWAKSAEDIRKLVDYYAHEQVDFIKVYSHLSRESYFALMALARELDLEVVGHRPFAVSAIEASNAGQKSIEHSHVFIRECFSGADSIRKLYQQGRGRMPLQEMIENHDPAICDEIFKTMVRNNTYWCPTHVVRKKDAFANDTSFTNDPRLRYLPQLMRLDWKDEMAERAARSEELHERLLRYYDLGLSTISRAHKAGVRILAGTDSPAQVVFPGSGLHDELKVLALAGIPPDEVLRIATLDAAEFFGLDSLLGSVEKGKVADLVLLDKNPLVSIDHVAAIDMVIAQGNCYDRQKLDELLSNVELEGGGFHVTAKILWNGIRSKTFMNVILGD